MFRTLNELAAAEEAAAAHQLKLSRRADRLSQTAVARRAGNLANAAGQAQSAARNALRHAQSSASSIRHHEYEAANGSIGLRRQHLDLGQTARRLALENAEAVLSFARAAALFALVARQYGNNEYAFRQALYAASYAEIIARELQSLGLENIAFFQDTLLRERMIEALPEKL